ncbi:MAG: hypothetical protein M3R24_32730 [Chloroflexota bacterium]|nr:hypothetical protein [Chloroflexota bacterium]
MADLFLMAPGAVAAKYRLNPATVRVWKSREVPASAIVASEFVALKKERITRLMLEYLEANLNAHIAQAYVAADPAYIHRQSADNLAILHGVLADKSVRLIEALQAGMTWDERRIVDEPA